MMLELDELPAPVDEPVEAPPRGRRVLHRWPEMLVVLLSLGTNLWNLTVNGWSNTYYAAAVRSMTESWSNFFFASFDPGGWVTVDKPPFAFWMQALSARVFGFSSFSILLPSVLAGTAAVGLLMMTVGRVWGRTAGIVAGLALALTPMAVAVSRSNNPDVYLVLAVVAAAWAVERATATSKLRWMLLAGAFIGVGFLTKLGAALIVVPALALAFLIGSRLPWGRRLLHLALGGAMLAAVSLGWIAIVDAVPSSSRPYVGGSTDGTAWDLVTGYNGLGRVTGNEGGGPGGGGGPSGGGFGDGGSGSSGFVVDEFGGDTGITRLFNNGMGDQVMWLAPLAAAAAVGGAVLLVRRRLDRRRAASLALFAGWAASTYVVFAYASGIFHNYYVSLLAPAVAALVGMGAAMVKEGGRVAKVVAAVALLATAALQLVFLRRVEALTWLRVVVPVAIVAAAIALVALTWRRGTGARVTGLVLAGVGAAVLLAPAAWSWSSLSTAMSGTFPDARPQAANETSNGPGGDGGVGGDGGGAAGLDTAELNWLREQQTTETWLIAVSSSQQASAAIIAGDSVMAIGGFSGSDQTMTADTLADLVRDGELRFVAVGGGGGPGGGGSSSAISQVVTEACTEVPASTWGGSGSSIYDCQGKADAIVAAGGDVTSTGTGGLPGQGDGGPGQGGGSGPGGIDVEALQACMAEQGVEFDPASGPPDFSDPDVVAALEACGAPTPPAGGGAPGAP